MESVGIRAVCLLIGYIFGNFQTAWFIGKANGIDIREKGSGNAGTTNTLRVLGKKAGLYVFVGDLAKSITAVVLVYFLFRGKYPELVYLLKLYCGLGVILGHNFPFWLGFKGGKGIAAMSGMILAFHWLYVPIDLLLFFGTFALTNYVSLSSLILTAGFFIQTVIMGELGLFMQFHLSSHSMYTAQIPPAVHYEMYVIAGIIAVMAFVRHRENIRKLSRGEERKTYLFKKNKAD
ncbi:MAG: glycerol-3-phosphate 1-O-acyltransferase PlsY [Lachnospiraceae bacterium]|nr:glycerol-3-phosphate 1-O-acyltransferase PlsY [Lachnospiraceae bacterium]